MSAHQLAFLPVTAASAPLEATQPDLTISQELTHNL